MATDTEKLYEACALCPRACGVNRVSGERGRCHASSLAHVAHTMLHKWEEPCLVGEKGSGTVFFSGCNLGCLYCQNAAISQKEMGRPYTPSALAGLFLSLEEKGAANINLVTAAHYLPSVISAIRIAKSEGLSLPIVYNTSGYESVASLRLLDGLVDIYLTDMRYSTAKTAEEYSAAPDYPRVALSALAEMVRQTGRLGYDENGLLQKGTIVRFLLLPSHLIEAKQCVKRVHSLYKDTVIYSLMSQYTPMKQVSEHPVLSKKVSPYSYASFVCFAEQLGIENAYVQEGSAASESFIPAFEE